MLLPLTPHRLVNYNATRAVRNLSFFSLKVHQYPLTMWPVISIQWDGLTPCSQVNGLIVQYRVQYTSESSGVVQRIDVAGEWNVTRAQISLTGLTPYTNYSIQVPAVNVQGDVGLYSDPIITQTQEESTCVHTLFHTDHFILLFQPQVLLISQ